MCTHWQKRNLDVRRKKDNGRWIFPWKFTGRPRRDTGQEFSIALTGLTILSLTAFLFEAFRLGYVPFLLRGVPHAYSYFHISGVHYVTVSCVLVPSMEDAVMVL